MFAQRSGLIADFVGAIQRRTDAPDELIDGAVLSAVAALIGRKCWMEFAGRRLTPCLWTVLVAKSSKLRKTTVLELTRSISTQAVAGKGLTVLSQTCSFEGFLHELAGTGEVVSDEIGSQGWFLVNEFGLFLRNVKKRYNEGMPETLTDMFDCPAEVRRTTRSGGTIVLNNPTVNILAASTVDWMSVGLTHEDLMSGFLPRFIFIPATRKTRNIPFPKVVGGADLAPLSRKLREVYEAVGQIRVAVEAENVYTKQVEDWDSLKAIDVTAADRQAFFARLNTVVLKMAILLAVSDLRDVITTEDMDHAIVIVDWLRGVIDRLLNEELAFSEQERRRARIVRLLRQWGGSGDHSDLLKYSKLTGRQFLSVTDTLVAARVIPMEKRGRRRIYRLATGD